MLIIEGPDMVGKTTLIDRLAPALGVDRDKCGLPEAEYTLNKQWLERWGPNTVMDRYFISEFIYGLTCRGKANVSPANCLELLNTLFRLRTCMIVMVATPTCYRKILEEHYDSKREAFTQEQCYKVNLAYYELFVVKPYGGWNGYMSRPDVACGGYIHQHTAIIDLDDRGNIDRHSCLAGISIQVQEWADHWATRTTMKASGYFRDLINRSSR
jgi:hypothetical protein